MALVIIIAGTPGTGKTTIAKLLAKKINGLHIDVSRYVIDNKLYIDYDEKRLSYVIDEEKTVNALKNIITSSDKPVIIDTHYPEIIPPEIVDYVFVLRTHPRILEERLKRKNWPINKVRENVMVEILSVVTYNVINRFGEDRVFEIDTTNKSPDEVVDYIIDVIRGVRKPFREKIDWLSMLSPEEIRRYEEY